MTGNERRDGWPDLSADPVEEGPDDLFADRSGRRAAGGAAPYGGDDDLYGASVPVAPTAAEDGEGVDGAAADAGPGDAEEADGW
ncbi:hypothetical protein ABTY61_00470 [Kitasatospora sp. NPDC096128]|uniref:hypothetical protein n=1 Tax=Kitasatospora sp. NPDC096128 TaxID=3155547 RepID=UPI00332CCEC6